MLDLLLYATLCQKDKICENMRKHIRALPMPYYSRVAHSVWGGGGGRGVMSSIGESGLSARLCGAATPRSGVVRLRATLTRTKQGKKKTKKKTKQGCSIVRTIVRISYKNSVKAVQKRQSISSSHCTPGVGGWAGVHMWWSDSTPTNNYFQAGSSTIPVLLPASKYTS